MRAFLLLLAAFFVSSALSAQLLLPSENTNSDKKTAPAPAPATKPKNPHTVYVQNLFSSLLEEIKACEKGNCPHQLRYSEQHVNLYDSTATKILKCWYKTPRTGITAEGELDSSFIRPVRIDAYTRSGKMEEYQIFLFEGDKLVFFALETPYEVVQYYLKAGAIDDREEYFKPIAKEPARAEEIKNYLAAYEGMKKIEYIQALAQNYQQRMRSWLLWQWRGY